MISTIDSLQNEVASMSHVAVEEYYMTDAASRSAVTSGRDYSPELEALCNANDEAKLIVPRASSRAENPRKLVSAS